MTYVSKTEEIEHLLRTNGLERVRVNANGEPGRGNFMLSQATKAKTGFGGDLAEAVLRLDNPLELRVSAPYGFIIDVQSRTLVHASTEPETIISLARGIEEMVVRINNAYEAVLQIGLDSIQS